MYLFQYNKAERRYYICEIADPEEYQRQEYDLNLHGALAQVPEEQLKCSTQCPVCQRNFHTARHRIVHFGYHGLAVQAPSERDEYDCSMGEGGMSFSIQSIIEARVLHCMEQTMIAVPSRDGYIDPSDLCAKISGVLEKQQQRMHVRRLRTRKTACRGPTQGGRITKAQRGSNGGNAAMAMVKAEQLNEDSAEDGDNNMRDQAAGPQNAPAGVDNLSNALEGMLIM